MGSASWQGVSDVFARSFPGCFAAVLNNDFVNDRIKFMEWTALDPDFAASYATHYISVNCWADYWRRMPSGSVFVSERHMPASMMADSEFYNDWLKPLDRAAGIGLKVDATPTDLITLPVQFPLRYAEAYSNASTEVSRRLCAPLLRAVEIGELGRGRIERHRAVSVVAMQSEAAIVVDGKMRLLEGNEAAQTLLRHGRHLACRAGRVTFPAAPCGPEIANTVRALCGSPSSPRHCHHWSTADDLWSLRAVRLPQERASMALLPLRQHVLIVLRETRKPAAGDTLHEFVALFGLTPAEARLLRALARGTSLTRAADEIGIVNETARSQVKSIFVKTETSRQSELLALLNRFLQT